MARKPGAVPLTEEPQTRSPAMRSVVVLCITLLVAGLAAGTVAFLLIEGWDEAVRDTATVGRQLVNRFAVPVTFVNLYVEESGLPVALPSDVLVANLGRDFRGSPGALVGLWAALVATVVAGSSNLYLISRRWGPGIARSRLGLFLHLTPDRLARSERWFQRWGWLAIVIGRHVVGLHVPLTAAAGTLGMPYRTFALATALTTAPWAAVLLWLGTIFGDRLAHLLGGHPWVSLLLPLGVVFAVAAYLVDLVRTRRTEGQTTGPDD